MISTKSKRGQTQQHREFVLIMMRIEKAWSKPLARIIKQMYLDAADEVGKGFTGRIEWAIDKRIPELRKSFKSFYKTIGVTFFRRLFGSLKKSGFLPYRKKGVDDWYDELEEVDMGPVEERFWKVYGDWSNRQMGKKIQTVTGTVKKKVTRIVSEMMAEETRTHADIAKAIVDESGSSLFEALRIARTETHSAAVFSTQASVVSTGEEAGLEFRKYWVSAADERSRSGHVKAAEDYGEDNAIPMDEPYLVAAEDGGDEEELMFPGDPSGSPENVINCRCIELYVPVEAGQAQE